MGGEFAITKTAPWQAQRFLKGQEYAAFAVLRDGKIRAFTMCKSSASQLNYEHFEHPKIREWVRDFAAKSGLTGQLCWDFIEDEEGVPYPIECNPRIHTQSCVFLDGNLGGRLVRTPAHARHGARRAVHHVRPVSVHPHELGADPAAPDRRTCSEGGMEEGRFRDREGRRAWR